MGRHPHPRHDQASGGRHVRRGEARAAASAAGAVSATTNMASARCIWTDASKSRRPTTARRRGGCHRVQVQWEPPMSGSSTPPTDSCCASISASHAAAIASPRRPPARRRWAGSQCWPEHERPALISALSSKPCTASQGQPRAPHPGLLVFQRSTARRGWMRPAPMRWKWKSPIFALSAAIWSAICNPPCAAPGRSAHPTALLYRDLIQTNRNPGDQRMNLTELQRSMRQLRLGGMAAVLEMRFARRKPSRWRPST